MKFKYKFVKTFFFFVKREEFLNKPQEKGKSDDVIKKFSLDFI